MNYYPFHIADWALHTSHLSVEEEGVYRRLIDHYYDTELPIPRKTQPVIRRLRLVSYEDTVRQILSEFFIPEEDGWHNLRADIEIKGYHGKAETARRNGKKGGRPKKNRGVKTQSVVLANPDHNLNEPSRKLTNNQEPITNNQEPVTKEKIPYQLIADAYNEFFYSKVNNSSKCQTVSPKRKKAISKLWNHKPYQPEGKASTNNIGYWQRYFEYSSNQAGLNGGKASKDFDWIADFDALMNFNKYVKNIEGGYA